MRVSRHCNSDPHGYQACGIGSSITNNNVLCGRHVCPSEDTNQEYLECKETCSTDNNDCSAEDMMNRATCDGNCDTENCEDEGDCGGYKYGLTCQPASLLEDEIYIPEHQICDGMELSRCDHSEDEQNCDVTNNTRYTCNHYVSNKTVPIHNYTRCAVFDTPNQEYPYCRNYLDQTNCTDDKRIGGWCPINGFYSTFSKYVICGSRKTGEDITICDNGLENACRSTSTQCSVHKHYMCNGEYNCLDMSDEYDDQCIIMTETFTCARRVFPKLSLHLPVWWILDGIEDCINGEDENTDKWSFCGNQTEKTLRVNKKNYANCQNVYLCPGFNRTYVEFDILCDGIESCGMENSICEIARDFPSIERTVLPTNTQLDFCESIEEVKKKNITCSVKDLKRLPGVLDVFGATKRDDITTFKVPDSKVSCGVLFGEFYVYLSCLNLCLEVNTICPVKPLQYDACPGQFPNRVYTLANNSFLTFAQKSNNGQYHHQNFYQCKNKRCVEYSHVCDLINDCGDLSDEENCT